MLSQTPPLPAPAPDNEKCGRLADTARSPRETAAAAAAASPTTGASPTTAASPATAAPPPTAAATSTASATSAAASATPAASPGNLYAGLSRRSVFFVKDIERRQADVGDFFLAESQKMIGRRQLRRRSADRSHCSIAGYRTQRYAGHAQHRYSFVAALSLRRAVRFGHNGVPPIFLRAVRRPMRSVHTIFRGPWIEARYALF